MTLQMRKTSETSGENEALTSDNDLSIPEFLIRKGEQKKVILPSVEEKKPTSKFVDPKDGERSETLIGGIPRPAVHELVKQTSINSVAELEEELDKFTRAGYKGEFDVYKWMLARDLKGVNALYIARYYRPLLDELNSDDPQVKEAYSRLTKTEFNNYRAFVESIVTAAENMNSNAKRKRKVRKLKVKKAVDLVKKVKYKKEDIDLQIVSLAPEQVVGAKELWAFDTRYRYIIVLRAYDGSELSIKGTTVKNYNPDTSLTRKVRKPKEFLAKLTTRTASAKAFDELKTTLKKAKGRINENILLYKLF